MKVEKILEFSLHLMWICLGIRHGLEAIKYIVV